MKLRQSETILFFLQITKKKLIYKKQREVYTRWPDSGDEDNIAHQPSHKIY